MIEERRQFQRLSLVEPLDGWFGDYSVRLIDVSSKGAQIEHDDVIPDDARALLRFYWRGAAVEVLAETKRTSESRSGLQFVEDCDVLKTLLAASATEIVLALEANARGDRSENVVGDETVTAAWRMPASGFVRWILGPEGWAATRCIDPGQPANGFTIAAGEPDDQVALLCRTYESGDTEARRLTRLLAELSTSGASS